MIEYGGCPAIGCVAIVAGVTRGDVVCRLAGRRGAIVAGKAGANDIGMIDTYDRCPAGTTVTVFTQGVGLDMGRVFAGCGAAVVTTGATAGDAVVVEDRT